MKLRSLSLIGAVGVASAFLVPILVPATASAQEPDGVRFRGGIGLEAGADVLTVSGEGGGAAAVGAIGFQGQLGVQITNNWAVYALPALDVIFGGGGAGLAVNGAVLGDYTFSGVPIGVHAGPSVGGLVAFGSGGAVGAGTIYGARMGASFYPIMSRGPDGIRRKALQVGLDLTVQGISGAVIISPQVVIGYQAF